MLLFLNKRDLFAEKIKRVDPAKWFPEYTGGCDYSAAEAFFIQLFRARIQDKGKTLYTYTTCATDTSNMKVVFNAVQDMIYEGSTNTLIS